MMRRQESEVVFTEIFQRKDWGDGESVSGPGSSLDATKTVRDELPELLQLLEIRSVLDLPCGDHNWMSGVVDDLTARGIQYSGADVVEALIDQNKQSWPERSFQKLDLVTDKLPEHDAVFVRDCLVHLPYRSIDAALQNIIDSGAKWLIATHFPGRKNHDIRAGQWRPLDMTVAPFYLPSPGRILNENCQEGDGKYSDKSLGVWRVSDIAAARAKRQKKLTIGMATFRDWPGVWATIQSIRLNHPEVVDNIEIVVVDNDPSGTPYSGGESSHSFKCRSLCERIGATYDHFTKTAGTAAAKGRIFDLATSPAVLVIDCHVILPAGTIKRLIDWFDEHPDSKDLFQGPCIGDGGVDDIVGTHFEPAWGSLMFGRWATNDQATKSDEPFAIDMQGCGLFACRKSAWPGFHPLLRGFGPEEFHIHQRFRRAGGTCYCLPWLRWCHRFGNPDGHKVTGLEPKARLRGHLITHLDTRMPPISEIKHHFVDETKSLTDDEFLTVLRDTVAEFFADRTDTGADCPHRQPFLKVVDCEIGCHATRKALPTFACGKHGECAPWKWQREKTMAVCLGCNR